MQYPQPADPLDRFAIAIFRVNGALLRNGDRMTKAIGQSSARWHVLGQASFQPQTVAEIARNMGNARQSVQRIANELEYEGLIHYSDNPRDKRAKLVTVTAKGHAVIADINARKAAWIEHTTPKLGTQKIEQLASQLEQAAAVLEQDEKKEYNMDKRINKTFKATIENRNGWLHITWPESVKFFGSTKSVKVKGTMNDVSFQTAFLPWGDGTQFLPVSQKMLKAMKAQPGDEIEVYLEERV